MAEHTWMAVPDRVAGRSFAGHVALALTLCGALLAAPAPAAPAPADAVPVRGTAGVAVSDPLFAEQWGPQVVRAPEAWALPTRSSPVVAVLDTGVDAGHPDLAGSVLPEKVFVDDGATGDPSGHGTAVAGVIAGRGDNGLGVAGYCWSCRILPVRVLDRDVSGNAADVAAAVRWAADNGADVINLSIVLLGRSATLDDAIGYARDRGVLVVAAAGNSGQVEPTEPAASGRTIGVVATDPHDAPYPWSDHGDWAEVAAPGCAVTTQAEGGFGESCGSSMAAPAVAGIVGLALAVFPNATPDEVEAALAASTTPVPGTARHGRVDAAGLLAVLQDRLSAAVGQERLAGPTRVETAVALSRRAWPGPTRAARRGGW